MFSLKENLFLVNSLLRPEGLVNNLDVSVNVEPFEKKIVDKPVRHIRLLFLFLLKAIVSHGSTSSSNGLWAFKNTLLPKE
jgi:hypothetical protein